jgi:hypothetical protein
MGATIFLDLYQVCSLTNFQVRLLGCMLRVMVVLVRPNHTSVDGGTKGKARTSTMVHLYHTVHLQDPHNE